MNKTKIEAAVARWIEEAKSFPPAEAARLLRRKLRFVEEQIRKRAGDAWALNVAAADLGREAQRLAALAA